MTRRRLWFIGLLIGLGLLLYGRTLHFPFAYDDFDFVVDNPALRPPVRWINFFTDPGTLAGHSGLAHDNYRPLTPLSLAINFAIGGTDPWNYHLVNLGLHIFNSALVFFLALKVFASPFGVRPVRPLPLPAGEGALGPGEAIFPAFLAAAIFLAHPVQVESVLWISSRSNALSMVFFLGSFLLYLRSAKWRSLGLFALALLSKEMAIVLPMVLLLWEILLGRHSRVPLPILFMGRVRTLFGYEGGNPEPSSKLDPRFRGGDGHGVSALRKTLCYFAVALLYLFLRTCMLGRVAQTIYFRDSFWLTVWTMIKAFAVYVRLIVWPHPLSLEYIIPVGESFFEPAVFFSAVVLVGLFAWGVRLLKRDAVLAFGFWVFFMGLAPVSNLIPTRAVMAERFMYPSVIGFGVMAGGILRRLKGRRAWVLGVGLLAVYSVLTINRTQDWRSSTSLLEATLRTAPASAKMHYALGLQCARAGQFERARSEFQRAVEIDPTHFEAWRDLGRLAAQESRAADALRCYERALALNRDQATLAEYDLIQKWALRRKTKTKGT